MFLRTVLCDVFGSILISHAQDLEVTKTARRANPTLRMAAWKGSVALRKRIQRDIELSDWFTLTWDDTADFYLEGTTEPVGTSGLSATVTVKKADGTSFAITHGMDNVDWLSHALVDAVILNVFKNPGFCSTYLAYVREDGQTKDIWVSDFDGTNGRQLTNNKTITTEPSWSFDQKYLSYTVYTRTHTQLIVYSLEGNKWRSLANFKGLNSSCSLANTDLRAAMCLSKDGSIDLYTRWVNGKTVKRLTNDTFVEASPTWSPKDRQICFVGSQSRKPTLFIVNAEGGQPARVLNELVEAVSPDWSPVSNKICFALKKGSQYTIGVVDMNGTNRSIRIPFAAAGDWEAPSWTADGRHLVCSRKLDGKISLFLIDTWYGKARELVDCGSGVSLPDCSGSFVK